MRRYALQWNNIKIIEERVPFMFADCPVRYEIK